MRIKIRIRSVSHFPGKGCQATPQNRTAQKAAVTIRGQMEGCLLYL